MAKKCKIKSQYSTLTNLVCCMACGDYVVTNFTDTEEKLQAHQETCKILNPNLPHQVEKFWRLNITRLGQWGGYHSIPFQTQDEAYKKQKEINEKAKTKGYIIKTEVKEYERRVYD